MLGKKILLIIILIVFSLATSSFSLYAESKWDNLLKDSSKVLSEVQEMPDQSIPEKLMKECAAIAIFPSTISAGFGIGGKYGQGIIIVRNNNNWSAPAVFDLMGASLGFQIGGQATDIVLLIMNKDSVDSLLSGKLKLGADAAVSAGPVGRNAEASTDIQFKGGILSYSRSRGLFAGIKLEGAVINQHWDANKELYGKGVSAKEVLIEEKVQAPESSKELIKFLNKYK